jgi:hypothetical protein
MCCDDVLPCLLTIVDHVFWQWLTMLFNDCWPCFLRCLFDDVWPCCLTMFDNVFDDCWRRVYIFFLYKNREICSMVKHQDILNVDTWNGLGNSVGALEGQFPGPIIMQLLANSLRPRAREVQPLTKMLNMVKNRRTTLSNIVQKHCQQSPENIVNNRQKQGQQS